MNGHLADENELLRRYAETHDPRLKEELVRRFLPLARSLALRYNGFASLDSPYYGGRQNATYFRAPTLYRDHLAHRPGWNYWMVNPKGRCRLITLNDPDQFLAFSKGADDGSVPTDEDMVRLLHRAIGADVPIELISH